MTPPPALQIFRRVTGRYPPKALFEEVAEAIGERPDVAFLERCYKSWIASGFRPTNLAWLFEWYQSRRIPARAVALAPERPAIRERDTGPRINEDERMSLEEIMAKVAEHEASMKGAA